MMRLREIIKNIKNWQVDLSDSLVQLFSTHLFTFLGLDINFDASSSLSVGRDLINWFDHYSWKTNRAQFTPHVCTIQSCGICVLEFLCIQETYSVTLDFFCEWQPVCTAYLLIAPGIYLQVSHYIISFMCWLHLSYASHLLSLRLSLYPIPAFFIF